MAEIYNNKLCIQLNELIMRNDKRNIGREKGFLKEGTCSSMIRVGYIKVIRRAAYNVSALVEFDSLRRDVKEKYIQVYGDPRRAVKIPGLLESAIGLGEEAFQFYSKYTYEGNKNLKPQKIQEYTLNARILEAVVQLRRESKSESVGCAIRINTVERLFNLCQELRKLEDTTGELVYPHTLPGSLGNFKKKLREFEQSGYISLIHKNYGNKVSAKLDSNDKIAIVHKLLGKHTNLDNEQIRIIYNRLALHKGWSKIESPVTIGNWRKKLELTTIASRRGTGVFNNTIQKQVTRRAPSCPLFYWTLDGWDAELLYQKKTLNKNGHKVTTYYNRLCIVVVLDPCKKYPVGYAIGTHESPELIRQALKNAIRHTRELFGERYKPFQLQSDNYQKKVMTPFYQAATKYYTPAALKNAKSKVVEPYFKYINKNYCQLEDNWSGFNITSRKESQPNVDLLNANHKLYPDEEGCRTQLERIIADERAMKIEKYRKAWEATAQKDRLLFTDEEYLMLMGETTGFCNTLSGKGLTIKLLGEKRVYGSFNMALFEHLSESWLVRYDPECLNKVLITNAKAKEGRFVEEIGTLRYLLEEELPVAMALKDQTPEDVAHRGRVDKFNENLRTHVLDTMQQTDETVRKVVQGCPELDILNKFCITDSSGNYKDQRSALRLGAEDTPCYDEEDFEYDREAMLRSSV